MNMIHKLLLVLAIACSVFPAAAAKTIQADAKEDTGKYPMACSAFEVDNVNASGGFDKVSCHNDFSSALTAMKKLGDNGVMRHGGSYSQTKIIAMNNGIAFAYPFRDGSSLLNYYQDPGFSTSYATTYSGQHYQTKYFETVSYKTDGTGSVKMNLNGFDGYVQLKDVDLVPLRYFTDRLSIVLGGNETFYNTPEKPYSMIPQLNTYVCRQNGNYKDMLFNSYYGWSEDGKNAYQLNSNLVLPAAEWMNTGTTYYSYNGYDFYTDMGFHNYAGQYYNYYQFLPMRSKSKISASAFDGFLKQQKISSSSKLYGAAQYFINSQNDYGINALMVYSMACLESAYGTSYYAMNRNNFFGWGAVDTNPNQAASYGSVEEGIRKQMSENLAGFLDMNDWRYFGSMVGNKGAGFNLKYASAVYWGMEIASIAYKIDKYSCGNNGSLTDMDEVEIGIVTNKAAKASLTKGGNTAYDILSCSGKYVPLYPVAVLSEEDSYYRTQCTNYVVDGKLWFIKSSADVRKYDWDNSVGWFKKDDISIINRNVIPVSEEPEIGEPIETLDELSLNGTMLTLSGKAYREGVSCANGNDLSVTLSIMDQDYNPVKEITCTPVKEDDMSAGWTAAIDLSELEEGSWFFKAVYAYANTAEYNSEYYLKKSDVPAAFINNQRTYTFAADTKEFISLTIQKITCNEGSHFDEETQGCAPDVMTQPVYSEVPVDDALLMRGVDEVSYDEETKTVSLRGLAFFSSLDAAKGTIVHELILVNTETDQEYALEASTDDYDGLLTGSGNDLTDVGYRTSLDLTKIETGNYYLRIRTINPERTGEGALFTNLEGVNRTITNDKGETVRFFANPLSNYRLEVSVEKQSLDLDKVDKPSRMTSLFGYQGIQIKDDQLTMDGLGIMYNTSMGESDDVQYTVWLEDENGALYEFEAAPKESGMDFAKILGAALPLTHVSFDLSADLSKLNSGSYRMYLEIRTSAYHDVIEMYSITDDSCSASLSDGRSCTIKTTAVRSRYILTIE